MIENSAISDHDIEEFSLVTLIFILNICHPQKDLSTVATVQHPTLPPVVVVYPLYTKQPRVYTAHMIQYIVAIKIMFGCFKTE